MSWAAARASHARSVVGSAKMPRRLRTFALWVLLIVLFAAIYALVSDDGSSDVPRRSAEVLGADLDANAVRAVNVDHENHVFVTRVDGSEYRADVMYTEALADALAQQGIDVGWRPEPDRGPWDTILIVLGVVALVLALIVFFLRRAQGMGGSVLSLRKTTARLVSETPKVGWHDVGGAAEAKAYLVDTVDFLRNPAKWETAGARPPRGILLEGPPGFGKTLLAKAVAGEAKLPFFEVSGGEFVELFVGVGAARVRDLFDEAKKKAPCVVFIDELDAIGRKRGGAGASLTHQEREQALDQMLVCLDGFGGRARVVVIAATNRADVLDPALLRPGRFDVILRVGDFTAGDRLAVLRVHTKSKPLAAGVDLERIAMLANDASGADLEQICNVAAMAAARRGDERPQITQSDLETAVAKQAPKSTQLDKLDTFLVAASSGIAQPTTTLRVTIRLRSGESTQGIVVWADPFSLKLDSEGVIVVLSRHEITSIAAHRAEAVGAQDLLRVPVAEQPDAG